MQLKFHIRTGENRSEFQLMYDAPFNFNFYSNVLSIVLCDQNETQNATLCPQEIFTHDGPHWLYDHDCKYI